MITTSADWSEVKFNGTDIAQVNFNGVKVWEKPAAGHIYGVYWDKSTAGTTTSNLLTRTDEAASFSSPVAYLNGASNYGSPFDTLMPWAGMTISGNEDARVVAIPKFWYKITEDSTKITIQIADYAANGFSISPAHRARHGYPQQDVVYIGRYSSYQLSNKKYYSKSGLGLTTMSRRDASNFFTTDGWELVDIDMLLTIQLLYLVEYADWSSPNSIGRSYGTDSWTTGKTDSMPYHTGTTKTSRTSSGYTQYRNIELTGSHIWGCYFYQKWIRLYRDTMGYKDGTILADDAGERLITTTVGNNGYSLTMKVIQPTSYSNGILLFTNTNTPNYGNSLKTGYRSNSTSANESSYLYSFDGDIDGNYGGICGNDCSIGGNTKTAFRGMKFGTLPT